MGTKRRSFLPLETFLSFFSFLPFLPLETFLSFFSFLPFLTLETFLSFFSFLPFLPLESFLTFLSFHTGKTFLSFLSFQAFLALSGPAGRGCGALFLLRPSPRACKKQTAAPAPLRLSRPLDAPQLRSPVNVGGQNL